MQRIVRVNTEIKGWRLVLRVTREDALVTGAGAGAAAVGGVCALMEEA